MEVSIVENGCQSDGVATDSKVFGIRAQFDTGEVYVFRDVSCCMQRVERLVEQLEKYTCSPVHLAEIVEDYVADL